MERLSKKWNSLIETLKNDILGKDYDLSFALVSSAQSRKINKECRQKDKPTNVLSFKKKKKQGELIICPAVVKKEVKEKKFDKSYDELFGFLVIHGMLHLKGMQHGSIMDKAEKKYDKKYFYRDRRGILDNASSGSRVSKRRKRS